MPANLLRLGAVVAAMWAGILLCIAAVATPSAFAVLNSADAGRVAGRIFAQEAYLSVGVALGLFLIERQKSRAAAASGTGSVFSANIVLLFGTLFCTVAGYFAIQPMLEVARAGKGTISFATLHAISACLFVLKGVLVLVLAWRLSSIRTAAAS